MPKAFLHPLRQATMPRSSRTLARVALITLERLESRRLFTSPCPAGSYSADGLNDTNEILASPGYYVPISGATMETPAQPGYYVPGSGATVEIPADLGHYVPTTAASIETQATAGYFVPVTGASAEIPSPAGSYISVSGASMESQAILAPAGSYAPAGSSAPISVVAGTYYPDAGASSSSQALEADPGYYVPTSGSSYETPASPGHYVAIAGAISQSAAAMGYYVPTTAATTSIAASPGYYVDTIGASAQTLSPAGSYVPNTGTTTPLLASLGHYVPTSGATAQLPAAPGSYVPTNGASVATSASPGYYVATTGATAQIQSPVGSYIPIGGATAATLASPGYYVSTAGATAEVAAPAGSYISISGATVATNALPGYYVPTPGAIVDIPSPVGSYVSTAGATAATLASAGYYVPTTAATTELAASSGYYVPGAGASAAFAASPGSYVAVAGATGQTPSPAGSYIPTSGATIATLAQAGYYVPMIGATTEYAAAPGTYVSTDGASAPTAASPGYYVATTGASSATPALPGYYVPTMGATTQIPAMPGYYVSSAGATVATQDPAGTFSFGIATVPTPLILSNIDLTYGQQLNANQISGNVPVSGSYSLASPTSSVISAGLDQQVAVQFTPSNSSILAPVTGTVTVNVLQAVPAVTISDSGGIYNGGAFAATALASGIGGSSSPSLEGVSPVVRYYAGTTATGTPLASAPSAIGTYTALASFPGSTDYTAASNTVTFSILSNANKLVFVGLPATATAGHRIAGFKVDLENAYGQLLSSGADASARVTLTGFSGQVFSARAVHGVAAFKTVQTQVAGTDTLTAVVADKAVMAAYAGEIVNPAAPAKLVLFSSRTVQGNAGTLLATPLSYKLEDCYGNLEVDSSGSIVTLFSKSKIAPTGWSGNTEALQDGVVTFDDLLIDQAGVYILFARDSSAGINSSGPSTIDLSMPVSAIDG